MKAIGIDIGTTKICAAIIDAETGLIIKKLSAANSFNESGLSYESLQNAEKITEAATRMLDELISEYGAASIGVTGQMHGIVYTDKSGKALSPLYTWQDGRGGIKQNGVTSCEKIATLTGMTVPAGYGFATHYFNAQNGLVPKTAEKLCTVHDYLVARLCGNAPITHISDAASLGLYDYKSKDFNYLALEKLKIDKSILPEVYADFHVAGTYKNLPVCVAIGDNQASYFGSVSEENTLLINIGTGSQISIEADGESELEMRPLTENKNLLVGASLCGGSAYALVLGFCKNLIESFNLTPPENMYDTLNALAAKSTRELKVDTRFRGTRENPSLRGSIENISTENFNISNVAYGVQRSIVEDLYGYYLKANKKAAHIVGSGNAVRKSPLMREIIEEIFGAKLKIPAHTEEAAYGAALVGLTACGAYKTIADAEKLIRYE